MNNWLAGGLDSGDDFFIAAAETMRAYFDKHRKLGVSVSDKFDLFSPAAQHEISAAQEGGGVRMVHRSKTQPSSFQDIALNRTSVRDFSDEPVSAEEINSAITIAAMAPSACNRQSARVHLVTDSRLIDVVLRIQAGLGGYSRPPLLVLVTADAASYVEATERNQPYVDGALFAMSLIYALEDSGIGTCALTAMLWEKNEKSVRQLLSIPDSECFVTFIAVGKSTPGAHAPRSKRASIQQITTTHPAHNPTTDREITRNANER